MKCMACGNENPDTNIWCNGCGTPLRAAQLAGGEADLPSVTVQRRGPYTQLAIALLVAVSSLAVVLFAFAQATARGNPNLFPKITGATIIGLILAALWAKRTWERVLEAEPDSHPSFRQRHQALKRNATVVSVCVLLIAIAGGAYRGNIQAQNDARYAQVRAEMSDLNRRGLAARHRFLTIAGRKVQTLDEYLQRCSELGPALNDYEKLTREMVVVLGRFEAEVQHLPDVVESTKVLRTVMEQDLQLMPTDAPGNHLRKPAQKTAPL